MIKKICQGWSNIGKNRFFNKTALITLLLISTFAVQTVSSVTMSSLTQTTETNPLSNIQELIQEYLEQGRNDQSITIQQEEIDSDINDLTKLSTEPEEQDAIKGIQQPSVDPITLNDIPTLVSPSNGASITDTTPYMDWTSSGSYMNFNIEIDNNADFSSPVIDQLTGYDTFYTVSSALAGGTYYWRVRE